MAFDILGSDDLSPLPNVAKPDYHVAAVNRFLDKIDAHQQRLATKVKTALDKQLTASESDLVDIAGTIATPIVNTLAAAEDHLDQLGHLIRNDLNGRMEAIEATMPGSGVGSPPPSISTLAEGKASASSLPGTTDAVPALQDRGQRIAPTPLVNLPAGAPPVQAGGKCADLQLGPVIFQGANQLAITVFQRTQPTPGEPQQAWYIWVTDQCCVVAQTIDDYEASQGQFHDIPVGGGDGTRNQAVAAAQAVATYLQTQNFPQCAVGPGGGQIITVPIQPPPPLPPPPPPPTCPDNPCVIQVIPPPCPPLTFPSCVQIDLCDWDKFCNFLQKCLTRTPEQQTADCSLDNESAWSYKDCDGTFATAEQGWLGDIYDEIAAAPTMTQASYAGGDMLPDYSSPDRINPLNPFSKLPV